MFVLNHIFYLFIENLPDQKRRRRYKEKLNKKEQEPMLFWSPESNFHYLGLEVGEI